MKRLLLTLSIFSVVGCSTYYSDPYYSDRYYQRRYDDRYYYTDPYVGHRYGGLYSSWYYDLYDPYSAMFLPLGYLYDPWYWDYYRFGVHRYPSRFWSYSFYAGRPWYYSPWYGGYGIYHPYGYSHHPRQGRSGVPSYVTVGGGESAQTAARGLAAEVHTMAPGQSQSLVRSSAVRVESGGYGTELLGTMATPSTTINGIPNGSRFRGDGMSRGVPGFGNTQPSSGVDSRFDNPDGSMSMGRAGFRERGIPSGWRNTPRAESSNGIPGGQFGSAPTGSGDGSPGAGSGRPMAASNHPWRDAQPLGVGNAGRSGNGLRGQDRGMRGDPGMRSLPRFERSERAFPSAAPRMEQRDFGGSRGGHSNGLGGGESQRRGRDEQ